MTLAAYNVELARIAGRVSEPLLGEIRLQWWRDALGTLGEGGATGNPIADALGDVMRAYDLAPARLAALADARAFDISGTPMPDMTALKVYLGKIDGGLFALAAQLLGTDAKAADAASRDTGLAWGLISVLRALPEHLSKARMTLPGDLLARHNVDAERLYAGEGGTGLNAALNELIVEARTALGRARTGVSDLPGRQRTAFLPLALVESYLKALARPGRAPLREVADINPLTRLARLTTAAIRGRV